MNSYYFLFEISLILFSTKLLGLISRRIKLPQVVGALLAGIIIGPGVLNLVVESEFIMQLSEIGVIFLMFIAGLETDIDALKKQGKACFTIAILGVLIPFALGLGTTYLFGKFGMQDVMGDSNLFLESVFVGVILTATSGDTGKAAMAGFADVPGTRIIVFYPNGGVSPIQEKQMVTQKGDNTYVVAIEGNFDQAQSAVKAIFGDKELAKEMDEKGFQFSSANSINIGRLIPQVAYYVYAYAKLFAEGKVSKDQKINVVVPTGNFGNILAAYYAKNMGLPIDKLICASNENRVLYDFFTTGEYDKNREFILTNSPSMDILISSNLERFLYDLTGCDDKLVSEWMKELNTNGSYEVSADVKAKMQEMFTAGCCDDAETMATIKKCASEYDYVIDTHTAVAKSVYDKYVAQTGDTTKTIIASTASPFKFNQSVLIALEDHNAVVGKDEFTLLKELSEKSNMQIPKSLYELKDKSVVFDLVCDKDEMQQIVSDFLMVE